MTDPSTTAETPTADRAEAPLGQPPSTRRLGPRPWGWMALALLFIGASGAARIYQEEQFVLAARATEEPPFPMRSLPETLGPDGRWTMRGPERELNEETEAIAGCTDYMSRVYVDDVIGVPLTVLVAFGPAERLFGHSPRVCFPAVGYSLEAGPRRRPVELGDDRAAPFDALVYSRSAGGADERVEVYYSFRHDGRWDPDAAETRKQFRHRPAMIKVQVERPIGPNEAGASGSPAEDFLAALLPEIERRLAAVADNNGDNEAPAE